MQQPLPQDRHRNPNINIREIIQLGNQLGLRLTWMVVVFDGIRLYSMVSYHTTVGTVETVETIETEDLQKYRSLTYSLSDNLKARDANASKNQIDQIDQNIPNSMASSNPGPESYSQ